MLVGLLDSSLFQKDLLQRKQSSQQYHINEFNRIHVVLLFLRNHSYISRNHSIRITPAMTAVSRQCGGGVFSSDSSANSKFQRGPFHAGGKRQCDRSIVYIAPAYAPTYRVPLAYAAAASAAIYPFFMYSLMTVNRAAERRRGLHYPRKVFCAGLIVL